MKLLQLLFLLSVVMTTACSDLTQSYSQTLLADNRTSENEFPIDNKLYYLSFNQDVCIAVITGKLKIDDKYQSYDGYRQFADTTSSELVTDYERHLVGLSKYFQKHSFKLMKRHDVDMLLEEFDTGRLSFIPDDLRQKFARETPVTHILLVNFSRGFDDRSHSIDITERQLVCVATGSVEASDYVKVRNSISPF